MGRKRKQPTIDEQLRIAIAQAIEEGKRDLAKKLIDLLGEGKEEADVRTSSQV